MIFQYPCKADEQMIQSAQRSSSSSADVNWLGDSLAGEGHVDVFFSACGCQNVLPPVIELVATLLTAADQLRQGAMLEVKVHNANVCSCSCWTPEFSFKGYTQDILSLF